MHNYHVHISSDLSAAAEQIDYDLWTRCKTQPKLGEEPMIEFRINGFRISAGGRTHRAGRAGAGTLHLEGYGLPDLLATNLIQPDYWYPLLTWYLPPSLKDGKFDASQALGNGAQFTGKGALKDGEYNLTGNIAGTGGDGPSVTLSWKVDTQGWLTSGEGSVVSPSGTVSFSIKGT